MQMARSLHRQHASVISCPELMERRAVILLCRELSDVKQVMDDPASALHQHRANIILVEDPVVNNISSTVVRQEISQVNFQAHQPCLDTLKLHDETPCQTHRADRWQRDCRPSFH